MKLKYSGEPLSGGGYMQFPPFSHPITGIALPVASLRTEESCGVGEFLDLIPFADFCKKSDNEIIQLLPINDTGTESSPYSALSAFALHPIYIRLQKIPEASSFSKDIEELKKKYEDYPRFNYREIREAKMNLLHRIFNVHEKTIVNSKPLSAWITKNPWIIEYAVFMNLKRSNFEASWKVWDKMRNPTHTEIKTFWENPQKRSEHLFFAWVQMRLDEQFASAVSYCEKQGIAIKGDIPIMMNEDSCDAWANPEFFRDDLRAGSPPDASNPTGQNWGFPIYNWDNLRKDGYKWWKQRLEQSAKYYHAYRIDHILGFFRIWSIPAGNFSGYLGWTTPHEPITTEELAERGFSGDRLRWLHEPHVPTYVVEDACNSDYLASHGHMHKLMNRVGDEELWLFKPEIHSETDICNSAIPDPVKGVLVQAWRNRMLQITGRDDKGKPLFTPIWKFRDTIAWQSLAREEQEDLEQLINEKDRKNEVLWKKQAEELLGTLTATVDMLACAEDLGTIPESVPEVLSNLQILGLKVVRWERNWKEWGQPFNKIESYPSLSVATTSVHDSSTLRGWWEQENGASDFLSTWKPEDSGYPEGTSDRIRKGYSPEAATFVLKTVARSSSEVLIVPIQDFLSLSPNYYTENPEDERINIPGSVTPFNWTYRIPVTVAELIKNKNLISKITDVLKERRKRTSSLLGKKTIKKGAGK